MEKKRTKATDIAEISALLDGKVEFQTISFNQVLTTDHGKRLSHAAAILANPEKEYKKMVAYFTPDYREQWKKENPAEQWIARNVESAIKEKERLNAIAYLQ